MMIVIIILLIVVVGRRIISVICSWQCCSSGIGSVLSTVTTIVPHQNQETAIWIASEKGERKEQKGKLTVTAVTLAVLEQA
jgi:hypothetical protein